MDGIAAVGIGAGDAARAGAVAGGEPVADVPEADTGRAVVLVRRRRLAIVLDLDMEAAGFLIGADPDRDRLPRLGDSIFDRILDDRLKDQHRHPRGEERVRNVDLDVEPVREADLLDVEIEALEPDLLVEADVGGGIGGEGGAEES